MSSNLFDKLFPWIAYPFGVVIAITLHFAMYTSGAGVFSSTYLPVLVAAVLITIFEFSFPNLPEWRPGVDEVKNDAIYMLVVQTLLPKFLAFLAALLLLRYGRPDTFASSSYWPHHWPAWIQAIVMILVADFFRYWFHVVSHKNKFFWRYHAVHHSPKKLYWINTGRFHPVEKSLQFLLDSLPFIVLGISEQVLALYFVFYAVNGFFQHSNISLKFGILNYLISTAELHRWHHSCVARESNSNYGNNTIIWDILFGTRYLPTERQVADLGLVNRKYPANFLEQLKTPFVSEIDKKDLPLPKSKALLINGVISLQMRFTGFRIFRPMMNAASNPRSVQHSLLMKILRKNAETDFGQQHNFSGINSYKNFCELVPVHDYEMLKPYFEEQEGGGDNSIRPDSPAMYAVTSGTTAAAKFIPVRQETLTQYRKLQKLFAYIQYRDNPAAFTGKMLGIVSPAVEGYTRSGVPYGSVSGLLYKNMPAIMRSKFVIPYEVFALSDYELKYRVILRIALESKDITYLVSANPSTFLMMHTLVNRYFKELVDDIEHGTFGEYEKLPEIVKKCLAPKLEGNRKRANELRTAYEGNQEVDFSDIWPFLQTVVTWTGGSCGVALEALRQRLSKRTRIVELGYIASEARGTITLDTTTNLGIPTFQENFFEFVERSDWENNRKKFLTLDQISIDREYYIFFTTCSGLYRYNVNDVIRVTGFIEKTPTIEFVQKGSGVTNITGEKLSEYQVIEAVNSAESDLQFTCLFFIMLAVNTDSVYELYLEVKPQSDPDLDTIRDYVDSKLCELNIEYSEKSRSRRLGPLIVKRLRNGTGEQFKMKCIADGQRESQYKPVLLQHKENVSFNFDEYVVDKESLIN